MKIFLDTADCEQIQKHFASGLIDGVTTNPTLILNYVKQNLKHVKKKAKFHRFVSRR